MATGDWRNLTYLGIPANSLSSDFVSEEPRSLLFQQRVSRRGPRSYSATTGFALEKIFWIQFSDARQIVHCLGTQTLGRFSRLDRRSFVRVRPRQPRPRVTSVGLDAGIAGDQHSDGD